MLKSRLFPTEDCASHFPASDADMNISAPGTKVEMKCNVLSMANYPDLNRLSLAQHSDPPCMQPMFKKGSRYQIPSVSLLISNQFIVSAP